MTRDPRHELLVLEAGAVHIWYVFQDDVTDPELLSRYEGLLTSEERERQQRFAIPKHRHQYLVTRGLERSVLSLYSPVEPAAWRFARTARGKPEVEGPGPLGSLRYNLSNTSGLIACAVSQGHDIGIDVEDTTRQGETTAIADRYFSAFEARSLRELPPSQQRRRFFQYWTLGEAYIKARGLGLAIPLEKFSFHLDEHPEIRISFEPGFEDQPEAWQFRLFDVSPRHLMGLGVRCDRDCPLEVQIRAFTPLVTAPS